MADNSGLAGRPHGHLSTIMPAPRAITVKAKHEFELTRAHHQPADMQRTYIGGNSRYC